MAELLSFGDISELHQRLSEQSPYFAQLSPQQFAQLGNEWTGTGAFTRGVDDNWVKQGSRAIDTLLGPSSAAVGELGALLGQKVWPSQADTFRQVGESMPRDIVTMASLGLPVVGLPTAAALAGSRAYEESGSAKAGLISGGAMALLPMSARMGEAAVSSGLAKLIGTTAPTYPGAGFVERTVEAAGRNVGAMINQEVAVQATSVAEGQGLMPIDAEHIGQMAGPQVAFGLVDLVQAMIAPKGVGYRSKTAAKVDAAAMAQSVEQTKQQGQPPVIPVVKKPVGAVKPGIELRDVSEPLVAAKEATEKYRKMGNRVDTALRIGRSKEIGAAERAALDKEYVDQLLQSGTLVERPDGGLTVAKQLEIRGDDVVAAAVKLFDGQIVQPAARVKVSSSEKPPGQTTKSEEYYRRLYDEVPVEERPVVVEPPSPEQMPLPGFELGRSGRVAETLPAEPYVDQSKQLPLPGIGVENRGPIPQAKVPVVVPPAEVPSAPLSPGARMQARPQLTIETLAQTMRQAGKPQPPQEVVLETILQQIKPYVDAAMIEQLQRPLDPNVPLDVKVHVAKQVSTALWTALEQALGEQGIPVRLRKAHEAVMGGIETRVGLEPNVVLLDRGYRALMAHVARLNAWMVRYNDQLSQRLDRPAVTEKTVAGLAELEKQPHGPAVLQGLAHILADKLTFKGMAGVDVGMIDDPTYYHLMEKAVELADPAQFQKVLEKQFARAEADRLSHGVDPKAKFDVEMRAAEAYIKMSMERETPDADLRILLDMKSLHEQAENQKVPLLDTDLETLASFLESDPLQEAKVANAVSWFRNTFSRALSFSEWNAQGTKELREDVATGAKRRVGVPASELAKRYSGKGSQASQAVQTQLAEKWNKVTEALVSGKMELHRRKGGGFEVSEPSDAVKAEILQSVGVAAGEGKQLESNWKNFRNRYIKEVTNRMDMMYERALGEAEPVVKASAKPEGGELGTVAEGNRLAYSFLTEGENPGAMALAAGAKQWFREHFAQRGMTKEGIELYSDVLAKVALAFPETSFTKVATIFDTRRSGMTMSIEKAGGPLGRIARFIIGIEPNRGLISDPRVAAAFTMHVLGHELFHRQMETPTPWLTDALKSIESMEPADRAKLLQAVQDTVVPTTVQGAEPWMQGAMNTRLEYAIKSPIEALADIAGYAVMGHIRPDKVTTVARANEFLLFSDSHTQQFLRGYFMSLIDMSEGLASYFDEFHPALAEPFRTVTESLKQTLQPMKQIEAAVDALAALEQSEPANYANLLANGYQSQAFDVNRVEKWLKVESSVKPAPEAPTAIKRMAQFIGLADHPKEFGVHVPWLRKQVMESYQLAQMYPVLQGPLDLTRSFRPLNNIVLTKMLQPMMTKKNWLGQEVLDVEGTGLRTLLNDEAVGETFTRIKLQEDMQGRKMGDDEIKSRSKHLNQQQQQALIDVHRNIALVMTEQRKQIVTMVHDNQQFVAGQMLMSWNKSMKVPEAKQYGKLVADAVWQQLHGGPMALTVLPQLPGIAPAVDSVSRALTSLATFEKRTAGNDWYMSEMRRGRYYVGFNDPNSPTDTGKSNVMAFKTKAEAVAWAEKRSKATGVPVEKMRFWDKTLKEQPSEMSADFANLVTELEGSAYIHAIAEMGFPAETVQRMMTFHPGTALRKEIALGGTERYLMERKLRGGREDLDMGSNFLPSVRGVATALAKSRVKAEFGLALLDPELRSNPELHRMAMDHFDSVVNPDTAEYSFAKRALFGYYLTGNVSSMMLNGVDPVLSLAPQLTQDGGGIGNGYRFVGRAINDIVTLVTQKSINDPQLPDLMPMLERARKEQRVDFGSVQETYDAETATVLNLNSLVNGTQSVVELGKRAIDQYVMVGRWAYGSVTKINSNIAFLAAYRMARQHGVFVENKLTKLSPEDAYSYAVRTVDSTQHGGGAAQRPVGLFSKLGKAHGAVGLAYCLSTYTVGTISMMARLGLQSISQLPGPQRAATRKAFGQMMMTQTALAGTIGLPGVAVALSVLNKLFPELEATKAVEDGFRALAGEDDDMGDLIADLAMRGVPNKVLGFDLSSRMALSNVMGINAYDGVSLGSLMGPTGGVFENIIRSLQEVSHGNYGAAAERIVPTPFKNMVHLYRNQNTIRDASGRPLPVTSESQLAWFALGFKPASVTRFRDKQRMIEQHDNVVKVENSNFNKQMAELLIAGDVATVQERLMAKERETNGLYNAYRGAMDVAEEVVDRMAPVDLARGGARLASGERRRLAQQVEGPPPWTEMQRLQTKKSLEQRLGVPGIMSRTEVSRAQLVDQLMAMNPMLGRAEAVQMANVMMGQQQRQLLPQ